MSVEENAALGRAFFEAQDRLRGGPDPDLCLASYQAHIGSHPPMTLTQHQEFAKAFYTGFPDLSHTIEETVAGRERVAVRFTLRGTHQGDFLGTPATRQSFVVGAMAIFRIAGGKIAEIAEVHGQFDQFGMMRQLGVIP